MGAEHLPNAVEVQFTSKGDVTEDTVGEKKVIWKDILSEGRIKIAPMRGKQKLPFTVLSSGNSDPENLTVSLTDLVDSFRDNAFKYVKLPVEHPRDKADLVLKNSGYAQALRIIKKNGKHILQAALGFTEPDIAGRVQRGSIPDVSSGILMNFTRKKDGRTFPAALHHIALTGDPIDTDLEPFKRIYASDDEINLSEEEINVVTVNFADEETDDSNKTAEVIWNEQEGSNWLRQALEQSLNPEQTGESDLPTMPRPFYSVLDVARGSNVALADEYYKGERRRWIIPFEVKEGKISAAPAMRWTEGKEALIAASDGDFDSLQTDSVLEKISLALAEMLGGDDKQYKVDKVSYGNQVKISNDVGEFFLADFALIGNGEILLSPTDEWDRTEVIAQSESNESAEKEKKVISLYDLTTPDGRVAAHRAKVRQAMSRKGV